MSDTYFSASATDHSDRVLLTSGTDLGLTLNLLHHIPASMGIREGSDAASPQTETGIPAP